MKSMLKQVAIEKTNMIRKIFDILAAPIRRNPCFFWGMLLLFAVSILFIEYPHSSRMRASLEVFGDVYFLCLVMMAFPARWRRYVKMVVFLAFFLIGVLDMVCYQAMGTALVPNVIQAWMQTNSQEAFESVGFYLSSTMLVSPLALILIVPLVVYVVRKRWKTISRAVASVLLVITMVSVVYGIHNKRYLFQVFTQTSEEGDVVEHDSMTREYLPVYRMALAIKEFHRYSHVGERLLANLLQTQVDSCSYDSPLIVLLVGESYNRHHASLYGYGKPTTPRQDALKGSEDGDSLWLFNDVVASYNLTFKSFQNMFTLYNYDSSGHWYDYPVLFALFRKAGYEVDFFSNQYTLDKRTAFSDYCEDVFMNNMELSGYLFDKRNAMSHPLDGQLLDDYYQQCDTSSAAPRLVVFHFLGLHTDFKKRYPEDQTIFRASDYERPDLTEEEKGVLADYDNAVAYNDKVVGDIIDAFRQKEAIIIYVPDHGELVYDGCREAGRNLQRTKKYVVPQFDIPFWIYATECYRQSHEQVCRQISSAVDRPFMTDDLPHLLLYLAGIHCQGYQPERNLIDPRFNVNRKRMICGEIDYDAM